MDVALTSQRKSAVLSSGRGLASVNHFGIRATNHRVWEVAHTLFGDQTPEAKVWTDEQNLRIDAGEVELVIQALCFVKTRKETAADLASKLVTYFENNTKRMNYPAYRARRVR